MSHCVGSRNFCLQTGAKVVKETEISVEMQVHLDLKTTFKLKEKRRNWFMSALDDAKIEKWCEFIISELRKCMYNTVR